MGMIMYYTDEQNAFIEKARNEISSDPTSRLTDFTKAILERKNFVFDAHCHIFDGQCISISYFVIRMLESIAASAPAWIFNRIKKILWRLIGGPKFKSINEDISVDYFTEFMMSDFNALPNQTNIENFLNDFENEIDALEDEINQKNLKADFDLSGIFGRLRFIISALRSKKMQYILEKFESKYAINNVYNELNNEDKEQLTIALGMDLNMGWQHTCEKSNSVQNHELSNLAKSKAILPFMPVDPRRADLTDEQNLYNFFLEGFREGNVGFFGVKCYPALGYLPSDQRLQPIFQICAEKNIPVLTHCGGEVISSFRNPIPVLRGTTVEYIRGSSRSKRAQQLNEPKEWIPVLELNPELQLCLGHLGGDSAWSNPSGNKGHRVDTIIQMMDAYNVYGDFSFNLNDPKSTVAFANRLEKELILQERSMFGTDFWVVLPQSDLNKDQKAFLKKIGSFADQLLIENVLKYLKLDAYA